MVERAYPLPTAYQTTATACTAARPSAAGDGVDTTALRGYGRITIVIDADGARTLSDPTGGTEGVELWGYESGAAQWSRIGILNNGADIAVIADTQSWAVTLDLGRSYSRLHVAGTISAGAITYRIVPIEVLV